MATKLIIVSLLLIALAGSSPPARRSSILTPAVLELAKLLNLDHSGEKESFCGQAKAHWLGPPGLERWQFPERFSELRPQILPLFEKIGITRQFQARQRNYRYALVLGGILPRIRARLKFLESEWNRGVRFDELVLLGSERALEPTQEPAAAFASHSPPPKDEMDLILWVLKNETSIGNWQKLKITPLRTPNQGAEGTPKRRANTLDTILYWLETRPLGGAVLMISSQPFIGYQDQAVRPSVPKRFDLETVGPEVPPEEIKISVTLDALTHQLCR